MSDWNGLSGWSCMICGCELDGPEDGARHQQSGECRPTPFKPYTSKELEEIKAFEMQRETRLAAQPRTPEPRRFPTPEEQAARLATMQLRPGETQAMRKDAVERLRQTH